MSPCRWGYRMPYISAEGPQRFIAQIDGLNRQCQSKFAEERAYLQSLPTHKYADYEAIARHQGWSYGQFLMALCEYEQQQRLTSRITPYLKESGLPRSKSLANFDFSGCPCVEERLINQ